MCRCLFDFEEGWYFPGYEAKDEKGSGLRIWERERERKRNVSWLVNQQRRERVQTLCLTIESWIFDNIEGAFEMGVACVPVCGGHMDELVCIVRLWYAWAFKKTTCRSPPMGSKWEKYSPSINQTIAFSTTVHLQVCTTNGRLLWMQGGGERGRWEGVIWFSGADPPEMYFPKQKHHYWGILLSLVPRSYSTRIRRFTGRVHEWLFILHIWNAMTTLNEIHDICWYSLRPAFHWASGQQACISLQDSQLKSASVQSQLVVHAFRKAGLSNSSEFLSDTKILTSRLLCYGIL